MKNHFWNHAGIPLLLTVLAACFLLPATTSLAQTAPTVEWGPLVTTPSSNPLFGWAYWYKEKAYLQFGSSNAFRMGYNNRLQYEKSIQGYPKEGQTIVGVVYTQKKSWVFTKIHKELKKELTLYVQSLDEVESGKGSPVELLPTFDLKRSTNFDLSIKPSADSSKILVVLRGFIPAGSSAFRKIDGEEVFFLYVFDDSMNLLSAFTPKTDGASYMDFEVNNDGDVFALVFRYFSLTAIKKGGTIELLHLKSGRTAPQYTDIPLEVSSFTRLKLKVLDNGDLFVAGIYFEDDYPGVFSLLIDPFEMKIVHQSKHQFSWPSLRDMKETKQISWGRLAVKDIIQINKGDFFVTAEISYYTDSDAIIVKNLLLIGFRDGQYEWLHHFPKSISIDNIYELKNPIKGYFATIYNGKLHLLFSGNIKNMNPDKRPDKIYSGNRDLIWAAIQPDGELTYQVVEHSGKPFSNMLPFIDRSIEGYPGKIWIYARNIWPRKHQVGLVTLPLD